jgi:hypothetical protein
MKQKLIAIYKNVTIKLINLFVLVKGKLFKKGI